MDNSTTAVPGTEPQPTPPQGWECPKCNRVNAPWMSTCPCVYAAPLYVPIPYPEPYYPFPWQGPFVVMNCTR